LADDLELDFLDSCPDNSSQLSSGWDCGTYDSRDTDNDGLSDHEEVFGVQHSFWAYACNPICYPIFVNDDIPFRMWGANPDHKDVFVEVDRDGSGNAEVFDLLPTNWAFEVASRFRQGNANDLMNPDNTQGLRVHFDIQGASLADYNSDFQIYQFDGGGSGTTTIDNGTDAPRQCGSGDGNIGDRRQDSMSQMRQMYFHHVCIDENGFNAFAETPGLAATVQASVLTSTHELGHNFGITHGGAQDNSLTGRANYFSVMNYAFSAGVPNRQVGFSDGSAADIDPSSLCETAGLGLGEDVRHLANTDISIPHQLLVDNASGDIDWNRDGVFSGCSSSAQGSPLMSNRAYKAIFPHSQGAQFRPKNYMGPPGGTRASIDGSEWMVIGYPYQQGTYDGLLLEYFQFPNNCTSTDPFEDECVPYSDWHSSRGDWNNVPDATGVDLTSHTSTSGDTRVYAAVKSSQDSLRIIKVSFIQSPTEPSGYSLAQECVWPAGGDCSTSTTHAVHADSVPSITTANGELHVAWRAPDDKIKAVRMSQDQQWGLPHFVRDSQGSIFSSTSGTALATRPGSNGDVLYMLRTNPADSHRLDILVSTSTTGIWSDSGQFDIDSGNPTFRAEGNIDFEWRNYRMGQNPSTGGYWQIVYDPRAIGDDNFRVLYFGDTVELFSHYDSAGSIPRHEHVSLVAGANDPNLHAVTARRTTNPVERVIEFHPYADGSFPRTLRDTNDFALMERYTCQAFNLRLDSSRPCGRLSPTSLLEPTEVRVSSCEPW
jgi:hypothetical protein